MGLGLVSMTSTSDERREVAARLRKTRGIMAFVDALGIDPDGDWCWTDVSRRVADLIDPTCEVAPFDEENMRLPHCSVCMQPILKPWPNFCPNCGARVTGGGDA